MIIDRITLYNYRLYKGNNTINFQINSSKNLFLISGENGFGKTTFLHSLIWCLYGKLVSETETDIRKDISNAGYLNYIKEGLNHEAREELLKIQPSLLERIKKVGYTAETEWVKSHSQYFVSIKFVDVVIPSLPCSTIEITRLYDAILEKESVEILIDGVRNELTLEIGPEIFINDFILNKDIAKFFFFDSEQIVSLAENNSISNRRNLCSAYNEVLGVRKYEELKRNIENIRLRLRKKSSDIKLRDNLFKLIDKRKSVESAINEIKSNISLLEAALIELQTSDENLQQQLAREGNNITTHEINRLKDIIAFTRKKDEELKIKLRDFLELAPFAIVGELFNETKQQIETDVAIQEAIGHQESNNDLINKIQVDFIKILNGANLPSSISMNLQLEVQSRLSTYISESVEGEPLINLDKTEYEEFVSVYNIVTSTYKVEFERLYEDFKKNKQALERNSRRLSNIQSKESDEVIISLRDQKDKIEKQITDVNTKIKQKHEQLGVLTQELATYNKQISELTKKICLNDIDEQKDALASQLIKELNEFLINLKHEKKYILEKRIKEILNSLMHKEDFISNVEVVIEYDTMDILLYDNNNSIISKDSLSKGEQQLYASSILKALVEESGIKFPVLIDSPLQKFDKSHSVKIITEFYPSISEQVVLFPLLHKELTTEEYEIMRPFVSETYIIDNNTTRSSFRQVDVDRFLN